VSNDLVGKVEVTTEKNWRPVRIACVQMEGMRQGMAGKKKKKKQLGGGQGYLYPNLKLLGIMGHYGIEFSEIYGRWA
jgi:hypothetical protein